MTAYFKVGDLVSLKTMGAWRGNDEWSKWEGKLLLVTDVSQIAVGENVFNVYKAIHGTKTMSNLRAYDLDLFA